jgi:nitrate reductase gamma subunit
MSNEQITYVVGGACGVIALVAFVVLILRPAWTSYSRVWERMAAAFLSLYVLAAFVGVGVAGGLAVTWFWDRIEGKF